jgi:uncharacterized protein YbjT (DUF2867 family)
VARILIVGGGCRGRLLAAQMAAEGHAVRITTRSPASRDAIEATGAECYLGTPDRLATLRAALENVTIACWLLGGARGSEEQLRALHSSRLSYFLGQAIDTTVRGFVYEAAGARVPREVLATGERTVRELGARHAIPVVILSEDPTDTGTWLVGARGALDALLESRVRAPRSRGRGDERPGRTAGGPLSW